MTGRRAALRRELSYRPFLVLLAAGVAVRGALMGLYWPAVMLNFDSARFARIEPQEMFGDFWMPAGYAAFAKIMRELTYELWVTIALQHLLGLLLGTVLFLVLRHLGVHPAIACFPAAVPLLSGDHLYLEHIILADHFLTVTTAIGLACAVRGLVPRVDHRWLAAAGALVAAAALTRSVGVVVLPSVLFCVLLWTWRDARAERLRALGAVAVPALIVFGLYVGAYHVSGGKYLGLTDMSDWNLYSRVAPFADCDRFDPPEGTEVLCEDTPPDQRNGPYFYVWEPGSPSRQAFPLGPESGEPLGEFAREAILHQPLDYLGAVLNDLVRYVEPTYGIERGFAGQGRDILWFGWRGADTEQIVVSAMSRGYGGTTVRLTMQEELASYQRLFRIGGLAIAALVVLTLLGMALGRGALRLGTALFGLTALGLYVLPVLTVSYDFRYGIPPSTFIAVSGTLAVLALLARRGAAASSD